MLLNKNTMKVSLCGMIIALSITLMFLSNILPFLSFTLPAIAGTLAISIVIELGKKWAICVYFCTSIICLFVVSDKESVLLFIIFFGYYPIIKATIESIKNRILQMTLKIFLFNLIAVTEFFISVNILLIPVESFSLFGVRAEIILLVFANITFLIYDFSVSLLVSNYVVRIHPKINSLLYRD